MPARLIAAQLALLGSCAGLAAGCGSSTPAGHSGTAAGLRASSTGKGAHTSTGKGAHTGTAAGKASGARSLPLPPSARVHELDSREVTGKVGHADTLPAAAGGSYVAPGAPSDAQIK